MENYFAALLQCFVACGQSLLVLAPPASLPAKEADYIRYRPKLSKMSVYAYHGSLGTPSQEESDMKFHLFTILVKLNVKKKGALRLVQLLKSLKQMRATLVR